VVGGSMKESVMNLGEEFAWQCAELKTTPPKHVVDQLRGEG
jgi:hypothetical protein